MTGTRQVNLIAFDDDGFAYAFIDEEQFLAWLEPQTAMEIEALFGRSGERFVLTEHGRGWRLSPTGDPEPGELERILANHYRLSARDAWIRPRLSLTS